MDQSQRVVNHHYYGEQRPPPQNYHPSFYERVDRRQNRYSSSEDPHQFIERVFGMSAVALKEKLNELEGMGMLAEAALLEAESLRNERIPQQTTDPRAGSNVYHISPEELAIMKRQ